MTDVVPFHDDVVVTIISKLFVDDAEGMHGLVGYGPLETDGLKLSCLSFGTLVLAPTPSPKSQLLARLIRVNGSTRPIPDQQPSVSFFV